MAVGEDFKDPVSAPHAFLGVLGFVVLLWVIRVAQSAFGWDPAALAVLPGQGAGLVGVLFAPLLHGSTEHLAANSLPLLLLGTAALYGYPRALARSLPVIWLASGLLVWLFARPVPHLGASGLSHGLMYFLFTIGMLRRDRMALVLALLAFFLYGGMLWTIFPNEPGISYETHLFGAFAGVFAAVVFRKADPVRVVEKQYAWEGEEQDDPVIGDQWRSDSPATPENSDEGPPP